MGKKDTTPLKFQKSLALENVPLSNSPASPPASPPLISGLFQDRKKGCS